MAKEEYAPSARDKIPAVTYGAVDSTSCNPPPPKEAMPWLFERPTFLQKGYMYVVVSPCCYKERNIGKPDTLFIA